MGKCKPCDHKEQIKMFPIGSEVYIPILGDGKVVSHTKDGRACIYTYSDGYIHTFHDETVPESCGDVVLERVKSVINVFDGKKVNKVLFVAAIKEALK